MKKHACGTQNRSGIGGTRASKATFQVTVRFTITAAGTVRDAIVIDSRPPRVFDQAALRAILRWTFKPRMVNGVAVERVAIQTFDFTLPD